VPSRRTCMRTPVAPTTRPGGAVSQVHLAHILRARFTPFLDGAVAGTWFAGRLRQHCDNRFAAARELDRARDDFRRNAAAAHCHDGSSAPLRDYTRGIKNSKENSEGDPAHASHSRMVFVRHSRTVASTRFGPFAKKRALRRQRPSSGGPFSYFATTRWPVMEHRNAREPWSRPPRQARPSCGSRRRECTPLRHAT
jgi:hypothetical protein